MVKILLHKLSHEPNNAFRYDYALKFNIKVVTPDWIVDSIQANELLPEEEYAPLVSPSPSRSPLMPNNAQQSAPPLQEVPPNSPNSTNGTTKRTRNDEQYSDFFGKVYTNIFGPTDFGG